MQGLAARQWCAALVARPAESLLHSLSRVAHFCPGAALLGTLCLACCTDPPSRFSLQIGTDRASVQEYIRLVTAALALCQENDAAAIAQLRPLAVAAVTDFVRKCVSCATHADESCTVSGSAWAMPATSSSHVAVPAFTC